MRMSNIGCASRLYLIFELGFGSFDWKSATPLITTSESPMPPSLDAGGDDGDGECVSDCDSDMRGELTIIFLHLLYPEMDIKTSALSRMECIRRKSVHFPWPLYIHSTIMAVTLEKIKFYRPHSLPARPIKSISPNDRLTPFLHPSKRVNPKPSIHSSSLISFPQPALHHMLPPRPPAVITSIHSSERTISPTTSSTSDTVHTNPPVRMILTERSVTFQSWRVKTERKTRLWFVCL